MRPQAEYYRVTRYAQIGAELILVSEALPVKLGSLFLVFLGAHQVEIELRAGVGRLFEL